MKPRKPIRYKPMPIVDMILHPDAKYLYVITWQLQSGKFRNFYLETKIRPATWRKMVKLSADYLNELLDQEKWRYGEDYPVANSAVLRSAYKRSVYKNED